jgi:hypothetical protein
MIVLDQNLVKGNNLVKIYYCATRKIKPKKSDKRYGLIN